MITSPFLEGRDRYERSLDAWVDNTHEEAFTHTVRLADPDHAVEVSATCTPSPDYEVHEARARVLRGDADPAIAADVSGLRGARMIAGFTRRLVELCGPRTGAGLVVDAGIEIARLARQTAKLPEAATAGFDPGDAARCLDLDAASWQDLPNSCFTYSAPGRTLLRSRSVSAQATRDLYTPPAHARRIFVRRRQLRLLQTAGRLHLFHSMHDNVHGFDIHYEVDLASGCITAADSIASRLPYLGLCSEPQGRIAGMIGQPVVPELRRGIQGLLGGQAGCAQLYDLTADLLKLLVLN